MNEGIRQNGGKRGAGKRAYAAPKAVFMPLEVEERLLNCGKVCGGEGTTGCQGQECQSPLQS